MGWNHMALLGKGLLPAHQSPPVGKWNELNSLVGNEIELDMMIPAIISRMSAGIKVTKQMRLNVKVQTTIISLWNT
jgi:hypothetical protein